ncbi:MAG: MFS transporter [bacterium]|nr:MFS transporter [bacterium]
MNHDRIDTNGKIPLSVMITYGSGEMIPALMMAAFGLYFLIFFTDVVGIKPALAGVIIFSAQIWSAIIDPAMGIISDRTRSRFGRRRPYLIGIAIPLAVIFWLVFTSPPLEGTALTIYFIVVLMLFFISIAVFSVPYAAMVPEMTKDYDERTNLVAFQSIWMQIGFILASAGMIFISDQFSDPTTGWSAAGAIFGGLCLFPMLLSWRSTRGWERHPTDTEKFDFRDFYDAVIGNRSFRYVLGVFLFSNAVAYGFNSALIYFFQYYMNMAEEAISIFFMVMFGGCILWVPFITIVANRLGKKHAYVIMVGLSSIATSAGFILIQPEQHILIYLVGFIGSGAIAGSFQLAYSMAADAIDVDEFKTNRRREGMYLGMMNLMLKLGSAVSLLVVSQYLEWIGYVANQVQTPEVVTALRLMQGEIWGIVMLCSVVIAWAMPMTRKRHRALLEAIEAKKVGQKWNEESIAKLL